MGGIRSFSTLLIVITYAEAQVVIRDSVAINPHPLPAIVASSVVGGPLLRLVHTGFATVAETTVPGVSVTASISVEPPDIPFGTAYELWFSAGGSSHLIHLKTNGCDGSGVTPSSPFPITLSRCGWIAVTGRTYVPAPYVWSCGLRQTGVEVSVEGNVAVYKVTGTLWYVPFSATVTVSASLDPEHQFSRIALSPGEEQLECSGVTAVEVVMLNGFGQPYVPCGGQFVGTALLTAKGPYATLISGSQSGSVVPFSVQNGRGSFLLSLDDSKGIIPEGHDQAEISVEIGGIRATSSVALTCTYPPPTVTITSPASDTTILLSDQNLPTLTFRETHTPDSGVFEPSITWAPGPTLGTAGYFDQIQDSLVIEVTVTAQNAGGSATDSRKIVLKKTCTVQPPRYRQADSLWADSLYDHSKKKIRAIGCALSSMAMAMTALGDTVNPGQLNLWMKNRDKNSGGFYGTSVNWDGIRIHSSDILSLNYFKSDNSLDTSNATSLQLLDSMLNQCALIIAQVYNVRTGNQHWVVIVRKRDGVYEIVDPGRGESTLEGYGNRVWSYLSVTKKSG